MKIFAVYLKVELIKKPEWLDTFREKYDDLYDLHITLKQPCFVEENQVQGLKDSLSDIINQFNMPINLIEVLFNKIYFEKVESKGMYIMLKANENADLVNLQSNILAGLSQYQNYVNEKAESYDKNFKPHLTIARKLNDKLLSQAQAEIKEDCDCKAKIDTIVLSIVKEDTVEESKKVENITTYKL